MRALVRRVDAWFAVARTARCIGVAGVISGLGLLVADPTAYTSSTYSVAFADPLSRHIWGVLFLTAGGGVLAAHQPRLTAAAAGGLAIVWGLALAFASQRPGASRAGWSTTLMFGAAVLLELRSNLTAGRRR